MAYNLAVRVHAVAMENGILAAKPFVLPSPPDPSEPLEALKQQLEELTQIYDEKVKYLQEELDQLRRENSSREKILEGGDGAKKRLNFISLKKKRENLLINS